MPNDKVSEDDGLRLTLRPVAHNQKRAAIVAGVSARTISNWRKKGLITPRTVGGIELYLHEDLERLVTSSPLRPSATPTPSDRGTK